MISKTRHFMYLTLVTAAFVCITGRAHQVQNATNRPYGRYSAAQVLQRAVPIFAAIDGRTRDGILTATRTDDSAHVRAWEVVCKDKSGHEIAHATWDAASGELGWVGHVCAEPDDSRMPVMRRSQAVAIAKGWLRDLRLAGLSREWRVEGEPRLTRNVWSIRWRGERRAAFMTLGARDGDLRYLMAWMV